MRILATVVVLFVAERAAWGQTPDRIAFQGKLTNSSNQPVNGNVPMTFRLYASSTGGLPLWSETQTVGVIGGIYTVHLGDSTSLQSVPFDAAYWLSVEVNGDGEMVPRYRLASSPYAFRSKTAEVLAGLATSTSRLNQLASIGSQVTSASLDTLVGGSNADALHVHDWSAIVGKPTTFAPSPHAHSLGEIVGGASLFAPNLFTGTQTIQTGGDGAVGMAVRANSAGQSANLQEWQNSSGSAVAAVGPTGVFSGSGAGLTDLNAAHLTSGTVPDGRLSTNLARLSGSQTFLGAQTFAPTSDVVGTTVRQTTAPSPTADIFVVQNGAGSASYLRVDRSGRLVVGEGSPVTTILSGSATLDFPGTPKQRSNDLAIAVAGAHVGDAVSLGLPASVPDYSCFTAWVSSAGTVTVRFNNYSSGSINPAAGIFRATIVRCP